MSRTGLVAGRRLTRVAVLGFLRRRARRAGFADGRSGAVAIIQRSGGALNLNVHLHVLVLDGVFATDGDTLGFHPVPRLTRDASPRWSWSWRGGSSGCWSGAGRASGAKRAARPMNGRRPPRCWR